MIDIKCVIIHARLGFDELARLDKLNGKKKSMGLSDFKLDNFSIYPRSIEINNEILIQSITLWIEGCTDLYNVVRFITRININEINKHLMRNKILRENQNDYVIDYVSDFIEVLLKKKKVTTPLVAIPIIPSSKSDIDKIKDDFLTSEKHYNRIFIRSDNAILLEETNFSPIRRERKLSLYTLEYQDFDMAFTNVFQVSGSEAYLYLFEKYEKQSLEEILSTYMKLKKDKLWKKNLSKIIRTLTFLEETISMYEDRKEMSRIFKNTDFELLKSDGTTEDYIFFDKLYITNKYFSLYKKYYEYMRRIQEVENTRVSIKLVYYTFFIASLTLMATIISILMWYF